MFDKFMSGFKITNQYKDLKKNPVTFEEIKQNQNLRHDSAIELFTNKLISLKPADYQAVNKFWSAQVVFFTQFLTTYRNYSENFPEIIPANLMLTKDNLLKLIDSLMLAIDTNHQAMHSFLDLLTNDCRLKLPQGNVIHSNNKMQNKPALFFQEGDSIKFACEQARLGKKVLIMDAANSQRPGAGAYKKGTFQEALTRYTDLHWKILVDFRNVLKSHQEEGNLLIKVSDDKINSINVVNYQLRFLKLMLHFTKCAMKDQNYFKEQTFIQDLFNYADRIYSQMQNNVYEVPATGGFLKRVRFAQLNNVNTTKDLFDENGYFKQALLAQDNDYFLIAEVAAPDKRALQGEYDRSCTFNRILSEANKDSIAEQIIRNAIMYTLQNAIENNVDIILLNAFGCGAFENEPTTVANIFSEILLKFNEQLKGKQVYFMDLNKDMCLKFGAKFSETLANEYQINPYWINHKIQLNILHACVKPNLQADEVLIAGAFSEITKTSRASSQSQFYPSEQSKNQILIHGLSHVKKISEELKKAYCNSIQQAIKMGKNSIHLPLLGTGGLKFKTEDSIEGLLNALSEISQLDDIKNFPTINLYIPDEDKYHCVIAIINKNQAYANEALYPHPHEENASTLTQVKFFSINKSG